MYICGLVCVFVVGFCSRALRGRLVLASHFLYLSWCPHTSESLYALRDVSSTMHAVIKPLRFSGPASFGERAEPSPSLTFTHERDCEIERQRWKCWGRKEARMVRDQREMKGETVDVEETSSVNEKCSPTSAETFQHPWIKVMSSLKGLGDDINSPPFKGLWRMSTGLLVF